MPPNTQQVCDNCRLRKTKCDRGQPCSSCASFAIRCQYLHSIRRRGPKGGKGRRLNMIKLGLADQLVHPPPDSFDVSRYDAATTAMAPEAYTQQHLESYVKHDGTASPNSSHTSTSSPSHSGDLSQRGVAPTRDLLNARNSAMSATIMAHVKTFMAHLFPIMPAVDGVRLLSDAANVEALTPSRYALLLSMCAVTRIQLRLDQDDPLDNDLYLSDVAHGEQISGLQFLAAAERARQQFSVVDNMSEDAILTSFFLFVSNGNLEKYNHAWFYLSQCISMALLLGYDREPSPPPPDLSPDELNMRRKVFWLLFITERWV